MEDNIFDAASKYAKYKKNKTTEGKSQVKSAPAPVKKMDVLDTDPALKEMLQKMRDMRKDLEDQLSTIYEKGKESKVNVSLLLHNTHELTDQQFKQMQEQEKMLTEKILAATPPESCLRRNPKTKEVLTQERQSKMRGARNHWIPVR